MALKRLIAKSRHIIDEDLTKKITLFVNTKFVLRRKSSLFIWVPYN